MLNTIINEKNKSYEVTVTGDSNDEVHIYQFGKQTPNGQSDKYYLDSCMREAELLVQYKIDNMPTI